MKNYVLLYHVGSHIEDTEEHGAAWSAWFESIGDKVVDGGNAFDPASQAQVSGGTVTMNADTVAGYSIVKAESLEEAVTLAKTCPLANAPDCSVNVYETMPM